MATKERRHILNEFGRPYRENTTTWQRDFEAAMDHTRRIKAKFDAAQTFTGNEGHWSNTDHLDPHSVANFRVRKILRSRSRYEIIENNPYLKGTIISICCDFVGKGPKLQITDKRLSKARRQQIEERWGQWARHRKLRQKLWRLRMDKIVGGEGFARTYSHKDRFPVQLDYQVFECDRVSEPTASTNQDGISEIDGVRFDQYENVSHYHVLRSHPGSQTDFLFADKNLGDWYRAKDIIHWFRQDRGWLRGIPELTPSLPLCALLRRYTLAIVKHAERQASFTAVLETEGPPSGNAGWSQSANDDPFDVFPVEFDMFMNLPWGYTMKQLETVPKGVEYDAFVGSILREITRPLLTPFNIASGSSKDSNMASGVLDQHIYKGGQEYERYECEENVLDHMLWNWWYESSRIPGYLGDDFLSTDNNFREQPPEHCWRWDRIGIDHTDPSKVAQSLATLHDKKFLTDRDIQEMYYNRSLEEWQEEVMQDEEFRAQLITEDAYQLGVENEATNTQNKVARQDSDTKKKVANKPAPKKPAKSARRSGSRRRARSTRSPGPVAGL